MLVRIEVPAKELLVILNHPEARYHSGMWWWKPSYYIKTDCLKFLNKVIGSVEDPIQLAYIKRPYGADRAWHRDSGAPLSGIRTSMRHYPEEERMRDILERSEYAARMAPAGDDEGRAEAFG